NVDQDCVINAVDVSTIYELPLILHEEGLDQRIVEKLNIWTGTPNLKPWQRIVETIATPKNGSVTLAMVGKYVDLTESYKSLSEALHHGGFANDCNVNIVYIDSEEIEKQGFEQLIARETDGYGIDAILIPGGFGSRGSEGKVTAARYAREHNIPYFGICLGLQMAVIEFARNIAGLTNATSAEFDPDSKEAVIDLMESQRKVRDKGGSMRLGAYPCVLTKDTLTYSIYKKGEISERHRHRFEFNNDFREQLEKAGLIIAGTSPNKELVEIIELPEHPWFIGVQFHPEFSSTPRDPHPLFTSFVKASLAYRKKRLSSDKSTEEQRLHVVKSKK
ncbi:MAG: CTP synthase, partial [Bdellovibrionales bacterium]|nr:CTP synthase [Bdellovibrionales bacterium]